MKRKVVDETISDFIKAVLHFTYKTELHIYKYTSLSYNIFILTPYSVDTVGK